MDRRISYHIKGKEKVDEFSPPPRKRIRALEMDTTDLIQENSLTLMGRLTNPSIQRLWSLIPFLSNRPYHFDQWMVILERWEPVISASFPSKIPFWIELQGLPIHLWKSQMIYKIGEEVGEVLDHEITPASAKMKVLIDGLAPLTKETVVEFPDGSEVVVTLELKNLKNHCLHCLRLSHEKKDCPGLQSARSNNSGKSPLPPRKDYSNKPVASYTPRETKGASVITQNRHSLSNFSQHRKETNQRHLGEGNFSSHTRSAERISGQKSGYNRRSPPRSQSHYKEDSSKRYSRQSQVSSRQNYQWREKSQYRGSPNLLHTESSGSRRPPLERAVSNPTESAARRQRVIQGEAKGFMAETATQMIEAATLANHMYQATEDLQQEAAVALSQDLPVHPSLMTSATLAPGKKRRGRPPLNKSQAKNTLCLTGAKSSKRNKGIIQGSPKRKATPEKTIPPREENDFPNKRTQVKQKLNLQGEKDVPSSSKPVPKMSQRLREIHSELSPDILFLMETKNPDEMVLKSLSWMNFSSHFLVTPHSPGGGGLALFWKQDVDVTILATCNNYIDTRIKAAGKHFFATFVYGEPERSKRRAIWDQLTSQGKNREEPWFLSGDFNDIIDASEKQGGPERHEGTFTDIRSFMAECDLYDLRHSRNFLSWRDKRHDHLVHCRLDRAMSNGAWAEAYPSGRCEYLRFEGSDHRPLITHFDLSKKKKRGIFRYDRRLKENEEIKTLIKEVWDFDEHETVEEKSSRCRRMIISWTRSKHQNSQKIIADYRMKLEEAMTNKDGIPAYEEENILKVISEYFQSLFTSQEGERRSTVQGALQNCISPDRNQRDLLKTQLGKAIGSGDNTLIWSEPWISLTQPTTPMGPAPAHSQTATVASLLCPLSHEWIREKVHQLLPAYEKEILEIRPSKFGAQDQYIWLLTKTGEYSAKSGYQAATMEDKDPSLSLSPHSDFNWIKDIWNIKSSPKMKFLLWKAMQGALPVGDNLRSRGINNTALCPHCGQEETCLHLFFHCNFASQVWALAPFRSPLNATRISSLRLGIEVSNQLVCLPPTGIGESPLLPWILWSIWSSRNKLIFEKKKPVASDVVNQAIIQAKDWIAAQTPRITESPNPCPNQSRKIQAESIRCFTDATWREDSRVAGFGWIFKDHLAQSERCNKSVATNVSSPLMAEAIALLLALQQALDLGFDDCSFSYVQRDLNRSADELAKSALLFASAVPVSN
ncbi:unnamed protein product [Arabidopsis halleri]